MLEFIGSARKSLREPFNNPIFADNMEKSRLLRKREPAPQRGSENGQGDNEDDNGEEGWWDDWIPPRRPTSTQLQSPQIRPSTAFSQRSTTTLVGTSPTVSTPPPTTTSTESPAPRATAALLNSTLSCASVWQYSDVRHQIVYTVHGCIDTGSGPWCLAANDRDRADPIPCTDAVGKRISLTAANTLCDPSTTIPPNVNGTDRSVTALGCIAVSPLDTAGTVPVLVCSSNGVQTPCRTFTIQGTPPLTAMRMGADDTGGPGGGLAGGAIAAIAIGILLIVLVIAAYPAGRAIMVSRSRKRRMASMDRYVAARTSAPLETLNRDMGGSENAKVFSVMWLYVEKRCALLRLSKASLLDNAAGISGSQVRTEADPPLVGQKFMVSLAHLFHSVF